VTRYITPKQAAEDPRLPIGTADWYRDQIKAGRLRGSKVGGRWLIDEDAIEEMVEAASNNPARRRRKRAIA
jgi:hypothetical protein